MENRQTAQIVRGIIALGRRLRAERPEELLGVAALSMLATLRRIGPVPAVRLAAEERLRPQSLTRHLAGLEREGLISRTPSEEDRRATLIDLTRRGYDVLVADIQARREWLEQAMSATLTEDERENLMRAALAMLKLAAYAEGSDGSDAADRSVGSRSLA